MGLSLFDEREPFIWLQPIPDTSTPGTTQVVAFLTGMFRVDQILVTTDNTADTLVTLILDDTYADLNSIVAVAIPAGAGTVDGIPPVDLIAAALLADRGLIGKSPFTISVNVAVAIAGGKFVWVTTLGGYL